MADNVSETVSNLIIDAPRRVDGYVSISNVGPDNPLIISGSAVTVGDARQSPDVKQQLEVFKEAGDAFMVGAGIGYTLGYDVFDNNRQELAGVAEAFVEADKGFIDRTPLGRSEGPIKIDAMREMDNFYDPRYQNIELRKSYYEERRKYLGKAYLNWKPIDENGRVLEKPPQEKFDKLTHKLVTVRNVVAGRSLPVLPADLIENKVTADADKDAVAAEQIRKERIAKSYQDGFKRAFESIADTKRSEGDFNEKYWYLK